MRVIDLSLHVRAGTPTPPSARKLVEVSTVFRRPGHWQTSWICLGAHTASHVDSPLHIIQDAPTIGQFEVDRFFGEAVLLDLTDKVVANYAVGVEDLKKFENDIKPNDIVVLYTGWADVHFGTDKYWNDSPYITVEASEWLCTKKPKAIGFDFFQEYKARFTDFNPDDFTMHKAILGKGIIIMEGFTNLGKLSKKRFQLFAVPIKMMDTEAAPARFFAIEE